MTSNKANTASLPSFFPQGKEVELCGLVSAPQLNRRIGTVVGGILESGRYPIILLGESESNQMAIKPENLKAVSGLHNTCACCKKVFGGLTVCGNCQMAQYCSKDCQQRHWHQGHKQQCGLLKQGRKARHDETKLPTDPKERMTVRMYRAHRWLEMGKYANAEAEYKAIMQEPLFKLQESFGFYANLANMIFSQGGRKQFEAIEFYQKAVAIPNVPPREKPLLVDAYHNLGILLSEESNFKDLDGAEQALEKALELDGGYLQFPEAARFTLQYIKMQKAQKEKKVRASGSKNKKKKSRK